MKVTFLGTGTSQGVPVIGCTCEVCQSLDFRDKRLRTSVLLEVDDQHIIIDTGPDFREQMLRNRVDRLDAVLFTHAHRDHTAGLDDIRAFNYLQGGPIPVYGTEAVLKQLKSDFAYIFNDHVYPGIPQVDLHPIQGPFSIANTPVVPLPVMHFKLPVHGFRVGDFSYITDANQIPPGTMDQIKGSRVLVLNALQREPHISHFTLDEALTIAATLKMDKTYLVHISHKMGLHAEVQKDLPSNVQLAFDGLEITL